MCWLGLGKYCLSIVGGEAASRWGGGAVTRTPAVTAVSERIHVGPKAMLGCIAGAPTPTS